MITTIVQNTPVFLSVVIFYHTFLAIVTGLYSKMAGIETRWVFLHSTEQLQVIRHTFDGGCIVSEIHFFAYSIIELAIWIYTASNTVDIAVWKIFIGIMGHLCMMICTSMITMSNEKLIEAIKLHTRALKAKQSLGFTSPYVGY